MEPGFFKRRSEGRAQAVAEENGARDEEQDKAQPEGQLPRGRSREGRMKAHLEPGESPGQAEKDGEEGQSAPEGRPAGSRGRGPSAFRFPGTRGRHVFIILSAFRMLSTTQTGLSLNNPFTRPLLIDWIKARTSGLPRGDCPIPSSPSSFSSWNALFSLNFSAGRSFSS